MAKMEDKPKCPMKDDHKLMYMWDGLLAFRKKEPLALVITWSKLGDAMLREISQRQTLHMLYVWGWRTWARCNNRTVFTGQDVTGRGFICTDCWMNELKDNITLNVCLKTSEWISVLHRQVCIRWYTNFLDSGNHCNHVCLSKCHMCTLNTYNFSKTGRWKHSPPVLLLLHTSEHSRCA